MIHGGTSRQTCGGNHGKPNYLKRGTTILYLVHDVLAQHDLISFRHRLARQSSFRSTEQGVVAQSIVNGLYEIGQENLFVVLKFRCPQPSNSTSEQLEPEKRMNVFFRKKISIKSREERRARNIKKCFRI
jgi:hypothetical protein